MASYTITKRIAKAGLTAAEINAHFGSGIVVQCADGTFVNGQRDLDKVLDYIASLAAPTAASPAARAPRYQHTQYGWGYKTSDGATHADGMIIYDD